MITKQHNTQTGGSQMVVTLELFDCYEDIERLRKSLLFCLRVMAYNQNLCGETPEIADVCTLIESLSLTEKQCLKVDKLLFP